MKNAMELIAEAAEEICKEYCKYPEKYVEKYGDPEEAEDALGRERCDKCVLRKLM